MRRATGLGGMICALTICCGVDPPTFAPREEQDPAPPLAVAVVAPTPPGTGIESSPVSLTATDGTGLQLVAYRARAVRQGPLALTELQLTFRNPVPRVIEGRFTITMPAGATISRFAMRLPTGWQEAEVVERQRARVAYEDFLHRRQDPALLEKAAGNAFRARIFPIPARGQKEIRISYSQELAAAETPYRLPLHGLPRVGALDVQVWDGQQTTVLERRDHQPEGDLLVHGSAAVAGLRSGELVVARVKPLLAALRQPLRSLLVLFDTSASRALGFAAQVQQLEQLLEELEQTAGPWLRLRLACFDQEVAPIFAGTLSELQDAHLQRIRDRGALGASDLQGALRWAGAQDYERILLITDGVATAGAKKDAALRETVGQMSPHVARLDVMLVGGIRDRALAETLTRRNGLAADGAVLDGAAPADLLVQRLLRATASGITVAVPGARWVWPERFDGVQPDDERLVFAELGPEALAAGQPLQVLLGGSASRLQRVPLVAVTRPLLERALVRARIARLQHLEQLSGDAQLRQAYRAQIIDLSRRFRVLSDHTALLVLETAADYARFGIDRRALADILIPTPRGPALLHRAGRGDDRPAAAVRDEAPQWLRKPAPSREEVTAEKPGSAAMRHKGEEGKMGRRTSGARTRLYALRGPRDEAPSRLLGPAQAQAQNAGVLGLLRTRDGGHLASVFGRDAALGGDAEDALGGLIGDQTGEAHGVGGLGLAGRGGGGSGAGVQVRGSLDGAIIHRIVRRHIAEVSSCFAREDATSDGRVELSFTIAATGTVMVSNVARAAPSSRAAGACIARAARGWQFPRPRGGGIVIVRYPFVFRGGRVAPLSHRAERVAQPAQPTPPPPATNTYSGRMNLVMAQLAERDADAAFAAAVRWREARPGDVLALVALGESLRALGRMAAAARAYGSIIDLYPSRADMRRFAGGRLESLGEAGRALATDSYREAVAQRPDHPNSHRLLAWSLLQTGEHAAAFEALERGLDHQYPAGRFEGVRGVLEEDLGLVGAAWIARDPAVASDVNERLAKRGTAVSRSASLRFVLSWETDANDVDLHVHDRHGNHAYYGAKTLASGGRLYADVTTGYGPECFTLPGRPGAFPYRLRAHYYNRGPMGYGMGALQIIQHDGHGALEIHHRPFVVMNDGAYVELGTVERSL